MSVILSKLDRKNLTNLDVILANYEDRLDGWKKNIIIDGKNIEGANIEQASWLAYYDEIKVELKTLVDFMDMKVKEIRGNVTIDIIKHSGEAHTHISREKLVDCNPEYLKMYQYYLLAKEVYNLADSITNQFLQRAYVLTNLVKIRVAGIQDITLYIDGN